MKLFERGDIVIATAYGGELLTRRVWLDVGRGVLICTEEVYQAALRDGVEPRCPGFPKEDVEIAP